MRLSNEIVWFMSSASYFFYTLKFISLDVDEVFSSVESNQMIH